MPSKAGVAQDCSTTIQRQRAPRSGVGKARTERTGCSCSHPKRRYSLLFRPLIHTRSMHERRFSYGAAGIRPVALWFKATASRKLAGRKAARRLLSPERLRLNFRARGDQFYVYYNFNRLIMPKRAMVHGS